jgi:Dockerin type I domain
MRALGGGATWTRWAWRSVQVCVVVALGLIGTVRVGWAFDARIGWQPVPSARGYRLYVRSVGQSWPAGIDVGGLVADADGVVRYVTRGLATGVTLNVAVSAYDNTGRESALSNVLSLLVAAVPTAIPTATATWTATPNSRGVATKTSTGTATRTATRTATTANTATPTITRTITRTPTATPTPTFVPNAVTVSGHLRYYTDDGPVTGASLELQGAAGIRFPAMDGSGGYTFAGVPPGNWLLSPSKRGGTGGSVSALDAARVLQVISGTATFTPLQALACDVTGDGSISALDASRILQLASGGIASLPAADACESDWLFVPEPLALASQVVTPPALAGGVCRPGSIAYSPLQVVAPGQDFTALVLGDCTGNWNGAATGGALQRQGDLAQAWLGRSRHTRAGDWLVPIRVAGLDRAEAFEARLAIDPARARLLAVELPGTTGAMVRIGVEDLERPRVAAAAPVARRLGRRPLAVLVIENLVDEAPPEIQLLAAVIDEQAAVVGP